VHFRLLLSRNDGADRTTTCGDDGFRAASLDAAGAMLDAMAASGEERLRVP
jgi:hypothetical protein